MADAAWKKFERDIASLFGTTRRLMKGTDEKMDIGDDDFPLMLDCKLRKKESWSIAGWLRKVEEAAAGTGQYPVIVLREPGKVRRYAVVRRQGMMRFINERAKGFKSEQFYTWNTKVTPRIPYLKQWDNLIKSMAKDKKRGKTPEDSIPMLFIDNKKTGQVIFLKPEDLMRIFQDGGLLE